MTSIALRLVNKILSFTASYSSSFDRLQRACLNCPKPRAKIPPSLAKHCHIITDYIGEREIITLKPKHQPSTDTLIYLHGGSYMWNLFIIHWFIIDYLIKKTGITVVVPIYRPIPHGTIDTELPILLDIYYQVQNDTLGNIFISGDSAGGGLTLALALEIQRQQVTLPTALFLFSPWLDVTLNNPDIMTVQPSEFILSVKMLKWCGEQWAGKRSVTDPLVSPLYMPPTKLPPVYIYQGTHDIFYPDAVQFKQRADSFGVECHLSVYQEAFHVFVGIPLLPESKTALNEVSAQILKFRNDLSTAEG